MRRISSHIQLIAAIAAICLAGQGFATSAATAASSPTVNKAELNKAVQEALSAKAQTEKGATGQSGIGSTSGGLSSSESFSKLTEGGGEEEATTAQIPVTTATATSGGVPTSVLIPIFIVGALLLGGIAFFIVRDARGVAPAGDGLGANASAAQERAVRHRKRRAKAKAARQQRKRNR